MITGLINDLTGGAVSLRMDPPLTSNFLVGLVESTDAGPAAGKIALSVAGALVLGGFTECSGLEMTLDMEEYKEGGVNGHVKKFPTRVSWGNITLKGGIGVMPTLWNWIYGFTEGKVERKDGLIILQNSLRVPHNIWYFQKGLPVKYSGPHMKAMSSEVAMESLEIAHEGIYQVPYVAAGAQAASAAAEIVTSVV